MATVVHIQPNDIGGDIGSAFGRGLDQGFEEGRTRREAERRSKRLNALVNQVKNAPSREEAIKLGASPEFADLFDTVEEFRTFGQLVDDIHKGEDVDSIDVTLADGSKKTAFISSSDKAKIAKAKDQNSALSEFLGEEGAQLGFVEEDEESVIEIFSPKTGRLVDKVKKDEFDPKIHLGEDRVTEDEFNNILSLSKEERLKQKAAAGGDEKKRTDEQLRAVGNLARSGNDNPTDRDIAIEMSIVNRSDKFAGRLATTFGMEQRGESFVEKIQGSGAHERFAVASTAMPDLMRAGLTSTEAFKAARNLGNAIKIKQIDLDNPAGPKKTMAMKPAPVVDPTTDSGIETLRKLDARKDKGKVYQHPDGFFMVYVGDANGDGEPDFEIVEP